MRTSAWQDQITFISDQDSDKALAIEIIDKALLKEAAYLSSLGMTESLESYIDDFNIKITEKETSYYVDMSPHSGEGHDFMFRVWKSDSSLDKTSVVIGTIEPEPDED